MPVDSDGGVKIMRGTNSPNGRGREFDSSTWKSISMAEPDAKESVVVSVSSHIPSAIVC